MLDEVVVKRECNIKAFCRGLNALGLADLVRSYPDTMRELIVACITPVSFWVSFSDLITQTIWTCSLEQYNFIQEVWFKFLLSIVFIVSYSCRKWCDWSCFSSAIQTGSSFVPLMRLLSQWSCLTFHVAMTTYSPNLRLAFQSCIYL